ncbi:hypothetical protein M427DRAFT_404018 [Gonapodya prolifera JEL478]|uniref:Uncharacterized protein n=1 Tax=Gonapodya prolifera (strain JEL478) TaxID=1344416 RepID=A0A139AUD9_GONPJ|nr:hypothetical protein M427DRAFT_404018 [Gonapodya prolifera JEL478]|eukprot:KXS20183.1 hypothetical protein M427DRAFT_404018 [Gonapodya prolifera JEL478]
MADSPFWQKVRLSSSHSSHGSGNSALVPKRVPGTGMIDFTVHSDSDSTLVWSQLSAQSPSPFSTPLPLNAHSLNSTTRNHIAPSPLPRKPALDPDNNPFLDSPSIPYASSSTTASSSASQRQHLPPAAGPSAPTKRRHTPAPSLSIPHPHTAHTRRAVNTEKVLLSYSYDPFADPPAEVPLRTDRRKDRLDDSDEENDACGCSRGVQHGDRPSAGYCVGTSFRLLALMSTNGRTGDWSASRRVRVCVGGNGSGVRLMNAHDRNRCGVSLSKLCLSPH